MYMFVGKSRIITEALYDALSSKYVWDELSTSSKDSSSTFAVETESSYIAFAFGNLHAGAAPLSRACV